MLKNLVFYASLVAVSFAKDIVCPGGTHRCPEESTCCEMTSGQYGCCPIPNAVCCSDKLHCCPEGYTCDVKEGACIPPKSSKIGIFSLYKNIRSEIKSIVCPGGQYICPDSSTCCKVGDNEFGCCPLPDAVCCSDELHCCPSGTECDMVLEKCTSSGLVLPLVRKQKPVKVSVWKKNQQNKAALLSKETSVVCPDGEYECPEGQTCCKLPSGQWGCCPLLKAVCCDDHIHCCPSGMICDVTKGSCKQGAESVPWLTKSPATAVILE